MSSRKEKRKRKDPRRGSFFESKDEKGGKTPKRRLSTHRKSEIRIVEDGFKFKAKKGKAKKEKEVKQKKTSKLPVPNYPSTEVGPEGWEAAAPNAPPAIHRFFEHVLDNEMQAVGAAFQGPFGFVSAALGAASTQFLKHVEQEGKSMMAEESEPVVRANAAMNQLRKKEKTWTQFLESADAELTQWGAVKAKCQAQQPKEKVEEKQEGGGEGWTDLLDDADQKFLEGGVAGQLCSSAARTAAVLAIQHDCTLKSLRVLSAKVDACEKYARRAGREVNAAALRPYVGVDPKAFIMDGTGGVDSKSFIME